MTTPNQIKRAYITYYKDTEQTIAHVEWQDGSHTSGDPENLHMIELLKRAYREGKTVCQN